MTMAGGGSPENRPARVPATVAAPAGVLGAVPFQIELDALLVLLGMFGLGLFMIYKGFDEWRAGRLIRDTATETVRAAAVGRTELAGTAKPAGTTLDRPFTDGDCLYASYRIEEEREDSDGDEKWVTIDSDTWVTDFYLDDGTGEMLVEPEVSAKYEISDGNSTTITVGTRSSPPPEVREFLRQGTDVDPSTSDRRKYEEEVIPPDESVYVLGGAEMREDGGGGDVVGRANEDRLVVRRDGGSDRFIISDMSEEKLTETLSRRAPLLILFGLIFSTIALYALLSEAGIA